MIIPAVERERKAMTIAKAVDIACEVFDTSRYALLSTSRFRHIVEIRQLLFYVLRKKYSMSTVEIGEYFNKDHATIIYATKVCENLKQVDADFRRKINKMYDSI